MTKTLIGLLLSACLVHAAESQDPQRRDLIFVAEDGVTMGVEVGPSGLFGIAVHCALNGSTAEVQITANENGRHFPLWDEGSILDPIRVRAEITSGAGSYMTEEQDGWGEDLELSKPFEVLDALALGDGRMTVTLTNQSGQAYTETFTSGNWAGLAALCNAGQSSAPVAATGRDRVLIDDIEAAVDRYRGAGN
ncbi:MAG: hypothetical protein F4X77_15280 [Acidobacteriia bacterium]|nr:hypothetical protein [Terriglobia bacterium]